MDHPSRGHCLRHSDRRGKKWRTTPARLAKMTPIHFDQKGHFFFLLSNVKHMYICIYIYSCVYIPRCSMYEIFTYIYPKHGPNVGKYSSTMVRIWDMYVYEYNIDIHVYIYNTWFRRNCTLWIQALSGSYLSRTS